MQALTCPLLGPWGSHMPLLLPKTWVFHVPLWAQHGRLGGGIQACTHPAWTGPGLRVFIRTLRMRTEGVSSEPLSGPACEHPLSLGLTPFHLLAPSEHTLAFPCFPWV